MREKSPLTIDDVQSISGFTYDSQKGSLNSLLSLPEDKVNLYYTHLLGFGRLKKSYM
jgi:hypothetical protein